MAKRKSRIRNWTKRILLVVHILISILFLYPLFFAPISFIWVNGFLGIAAPYLVVAEILFFFIWLVAKPIISIFSIITLVIGWNTMLSLFAWHPGTPFSQKKKNDILRIASWNVKEFNGNQKIITVHKFRAEEIAYSIQKWNPDIICMQEYNTKEHADDAANHAQYFEKKYPHSFFSKDYQTSDPTYFAGCIIYSKYPIIYAERIPYINQESLIYVDVLKGDDTIRIYTTHLASYQFKDFDYQTQAQISAPADLAVKANWGVVRKMKRAFVRRAVQAEMVRAYLNKSPYPAILAGDFNDVPSSYTYKTIRGNWQDAFLNKGFGVGSTFLGISPTLRIDYILANANWEIKGWESVDENLSDHHLILSDLRLLKN